MPRIFIAIHGAYAEASGMSGLRRGLMSNVVVLHLFTTALCAAVLLFPLSVFSCFPVRSFNGLRGNAAVLPTNRAAPSGAASVTMGGNIREMRERISTVKNTEKITEAMRLVSAAKVASGGRDAVLRTVAPFPETPAEGGWVASSSASRLTPSNCRC
eukprot:TRINITY_DN11840_c0_g1_i1.p3 TRINITY_DN11840_c0_g1~~TRINITY_DN11840_c0_g1_i1.p3  ORF type:complete len:157 (-),score=15.62 TRINITY_DN11840_c0_g1_i1:25-495(-)